MFENRGWLVKEGAERRGSILKSWIVTSEIIWRKEINPDKWKRAKVELKQMNRYPQQCNYFTFVSQNLKKSMAHYWWWNIINRFLINFRDNDPFFSGYELWFAGRENLRGSKNKISQHNFTFFFPSIRGRSEAGRVLIPGRGCKFYFDVSSTKLEKSSTAPVWMKRQCLSLSMASDELCRLVAYSSSPGVPFLLPDAEPIDQLLPQALSN